jgi:uncharacterized Zn finger protein
MGDEDDRGFPCAHCGSQCPCPVEVVREYPGKKVRLQCPKCGKLFDIEMPAKGDTSS